MARPPQTVANMVRSMIVVVVGTALIVIATLFKGSTEPAVDYRPMWSAAQRQITSFTPLAPSPLPKGWKVISVRSTSDTWHLGMRTSSGAYLAIEQGSSAASWKKSAVAQGEWNGWKQWDSANWRALTKTNLTLCGDGSLAELKSLAQSLRG